MGNGGGGVTTQYTSGYSGQGGGRIIPGTSENKAPWSFVTAIAGGAITSTVQDNRYNTTGLAYIFSEAYGAPPSAAGQSGRGSEYVVSNTSSGTAYATSGAGGGWGAQGGTFYLSDGWFATGAAGGKAINTVGNTVTWIGGSSRVYGAIG